MSEDEIIKEILKVYATDVQPLDSDLRTFKAVLDYVSRDYCIIPKRNLQKECTQTKEVANVFWRKPEEEMPKDGQLILIREYYRSARNGRFVNHVKEFMFFEDYGFELEERINSHLGYRITHWMPIPELNITQ